jgi:hypothetical protein
MLRQSRQSSVARVRDELGALEASAERAGAALACLYSSSDEFEAAQIDARRAGMWVPFQVDGMRVVLLATAFAAAVALAAIGALAAISL